MVKLSSITGEGQSIEDANIAAVNKYNDIFVDKVKRIVSIQTQHLDKYQLSQFIVTIWFEYADPITETAQPTVRRYIGQKQDPLTNS